MVGVRNELHHVVATVAVSILSHLGDFGVGADEPGVVQGIFYEDTLILVLVKKF